LEATIRKIESNEQFLATRKVDLVDFTKTLEIENVNYEHDTKVYEDLIQEFGKEVTACNEALDILRSAEFSGYLADRMSQKGQVIGTHADAGQSGIRVN
jgi:hypothetical protein